MTRREIVRVIFVFVLAAMVFTWPLAKAPFTRLAAPIGPGDPYLNLWILGWDLGTIAHDPLALLTGRIFDANIFHPARQTLTYSDHLIPQALALWPAWAVTHNLVFCYNLLLLLSLAACGIAMYVYARAVTGSVAGAWLAGLAWAFFPFHFAHWLHVQLQSLYLLPIAFLFLHRIMAGRRRLDALGLGVTAGLQAASSAYWGVIGAVALVVAAVALAVGIGRWRSTLILKRLLLAGVVGALAVAPFAWPYWVTQRSEGFGRNLFSASQHEAQLVSYLRVPPGNDVYGRSGILRPTEPPAPDRREGPEQELFPGFVLLALAVFGAARGWRRDQHPLVLAMTLVAAAGVCLSLGPDGWRAAYALAHQVVFGFHAIRAPSRFGVLPVFAAATLAAIGLRDLVARLASWRGLQRRHAEVVAAVVIGVAALEYANVPVPTVAGPPASTPWGQWLAAAPGAGAVLYLPIDGDTGDTAAMVDSLQHRRPIVNGNSGQRPTFFSGVRDALHDLPSPSSLWTLRDLGVRFVVAQVPLASPAPAGGPLVERVRFDKVAIYELTWTQETEAAVPRPEAPPPPDAGTLPFAMSERTTYQVAWLSGGAGVSAGTAAVTARADGPGRGWHFVVDVNTADWVARFFEAHDRFECRVDEGLLPTISEQHLREGRRVLDRATVFDRLAGVVTVGEGGPRLPLPKGARDGLSAFFYARTLPLAEGYEAAFPVVEGGRTTDVTLRVTGVDRVEVAGRSVEAWRIEPRFETRTEQRRALRATLWVSRDERRVPLRLDIDTGFGSFRAELASHEAR